MTNEGIPTNSPATRKLSAFCNFQFSVLNFQFFHSAAPSENAMIEDE
jgi:hypothetical protein